MIRAALVFVAMTLLTGCGSQALKEIGVPPTMSPVGSGLAANGHSMYTYPPSPSGQLTR